MGLLLLGVAACTFPDVGLEPGAGGAGSGLTTGSSTSTSDVGTSTGQGGAPATTGSAGPASGGGDTSSAGPASGGGDTTSSASTGQGGDGQGGATTGQGGDGQGGATTGQGGDGGAAATTTGSSSSSGGGCPVGCDVCDDDCPVDATPEDCDADGDPDSGDAPDCHRCNDRVNHQQTTFFVDPYQRIGGGTSFDYNCNGVPDRDHPTRTNGCGVAVGDCPGSRVYLLESPPACGMPAPYDPCSDNGLGCSGGVDGSALVGCN